MELSFCTISNERFQLLVDPTDTVGTVKKNLANKYGFSSNKTRLIFKAHILSDDKTLQECQIDKDACIVLHNTTQKKKTPKKFPKNANSQEQSDPNNVNQEQDAKRDSTSPMPTTEPIPEITRNVNHRDPTGFAEQVQELESMGFSKCDCQDALRAALYNIDRAADYLLSGNIPSIPPMLDESDLPAIDEEEEDDYEEIDENNQELYLRRMARFRRQLIQNPEMLRQFLNEMAEENPAVAGLIRDDPATFLGSIGLNPADFDLSGLGRTTQYEEMMKQFNDSEKESIHRLEKLGFDTMTVIQVFVACGKDESLTNTCLSSMK